MSVRPYEYARPFYNGKGELIVGFCDGCHNEITYDQWDLGHQCPYTQLQFIPDIAGRDI